MKIKQFLGVALSLLMTTNLLFAGLEPNLLLTEQRPTIGSKISNVFGQINIPIAALILVSCGLVLMCFKKSEECASISEELKKRQQASVDLGEQNAEEVRAEQAQPEINRSRYEQSVVANQGGPLIAKLPISNEAESIEVESLLSQEQDVVVQPLSLNREQHVQEQRLEVSVARSEEESKISGEGRVEKIERGLSGLQEYIKKKASNYQVTSQASKGRLNWGQYSKHLLTTSYANEIREKEYEKLVTKTAINWQSLDFLIRQHGPVVAYVQHGYSNLRIMRERSQPIMPKATTFAKRSLKPWEYITSLHNRKDEAAKKELAEIIGMACYYWIALEAAVSKDGALVLFEGETGRISCRKLIETKPTPLATQKDPKEGLVAIPGVINGWTLPFSA